MMINWRTYGPIDQATILAELRGVNSPMLAEWDQILDEAGDHSALMLAMCWHESRYATAFNANSPVNRNPLNLRPRGGLPGFLRFQSYSACIFEWRSRITDSAYSYAGTVTLQDLVHIYAPSTDQNNEAEYVAAVAAKLAQWGIHGKDTIVTELTFGRVAHPPFIDRLIPDNETAAYDDLGTMSPVGVCQHSMVGSLWGTDRWFRRGRGVSNGLTNYGIGNSTDGPQWDGVIMRWNRPDGRATSVNYTDDDGTRHEGPVSARRAGWANGGSDGLEGDGPLFVRTLGIAAINRDLVSIERSDGGDTTTPMSAKQFEAICALSAYWFDAAKVPWNTFPLNPAVGVVTHLLHLEFATKTCPHPPVVSRIDEIQNRIRAILKAGQLKVDEPTTPPVTPPTPHHDAWPYPLAELVDRFGKLPIRQLDGSMKLAGFSTKGVISNAWAARAAKEGMKTARDIPRPLQGFEAIDAQGLQQTIITFDGKGKGAWVLFRPAKEVSWRWLD